MKRTIPLNSKKKKGLRGGGKKILPETGPKKPEGLSRGGTWVWEKSRVQGLGKNGKSVKRNRTLQYKRKRGGEKMGFTSLQGGPKGKGYLV